MKLNYLLIGSFAIWCIVASQWFLFDVVELSSDPSHFHPHKTTAGIVGILVIMLITVLMGFGIAWLLQQQYINSSRLSVKQLKKEMITQIEKKKQALDNWIKAEEKINRIKQDYRNNFIFWKRENEKLKLEDGQQKTKWLPLQEEIQTLKNKTQLTDAKNEKLTVQIKELEDQITQLQVTNEKLKTTLNKQKTTPKNSTTKPIFTHVSVNQPLSINRHLAGAKDDLKKISGIGSVIEKKLNELGIYTFHRISELTTEDIEEIKQSIQYFPKRIIRDNWIGQAKELLQGENKVTIHTSYPSSQN